jgi:AcrR family transcriptional regulator
VDKGESERARRLPPGPHGLPPELIERNQRERLIAAMAEVCAQNGYGSTSVTEVTRHAGVSTASFYRQFKDKRECMLASFEELFGRLLGEVERACEAEAGRRRRQKRGFALPRACWPVTPPPRGCSLWRSALSGRRACGSNTRRSSNWRRGCGTPETPMPPSQTKVSLLVHSARHGSRIACDNRFHVRSPQGSLPELIRSQHEEFKRLQEKRDEEVRAFVEGGAGT